RSACGGRADARVPDDQAPRAAGGLPTCGRARRARARAARRAGRAARRAGGRGRARAAAGRSRVRDGRVTTAGRSERSREVTAIRAMGRRALDPAAEGWRKTAYLRGDVLDRTAVDALVAGADAVVHLAFAIMGAGGDEGHRVNLEGSRNVFAAAVAAGARRLVYTSSVAAYGFHPDNPS